MNQAHVIKTPVKPVVIALTDKQLEQMRPIIRAGIEAAERGKPGMILAQIAGEHMEVGFMPHDEAIRRNLASAGDAEMTPERMRGKFAAQAEAVE